MTFIYNNELKIIGRQEKAITKLYCFGFLCFFFYSIFLIFGIFAVVVGELFTGENRKKLLNRGNYDICFYIRIFSQPFDRI